MFAYDELIKRISELSGISKKEIERKIEAKRAKLSGLITKEGAAQIIAAELGINFEGQYLKINQLMPGMRKINVVGKVIEILPVRKFIRNGKEGKVASFILADETSNIRVVLWDTNHIKLIEERIIKEGSIVEINNPNIRGKNTKELHLGTISDIKPSNEKLGDVITEKKIEEKKLSDISVGERLKVRAFVLQIFEPKFFNICPECKKKVTLEEGGKFYCPDHGNIFPEERALLVLIIDDGSENLRAICFYDLIKKLFSLDSIEKLKDIDFFLKKKKEILGREFFFTGRIRKNVLFNNLEFIIEDVQEVNLDELIKKLS